MFNCASATFSKLETTSLHAPASVIGTPAYGRPDLLWIMGRCLLQLIKTKMSLLLVDNAARVNNHMVRCIHHNQERL